MQCADLLIVVYKFASAIEVDTTVSYLVLYLVCIT